MRCVIIEKGSINLEISRDYLKDTLEKLENTEDRSSYIAQTLSDMGYRVEVFENGTIFALLLGDMPSKEGSLFAASFDDAHLPAAAELLTAAKKVTDPTSYNSRIHHPDIEFVFMATPDEQGKPNFQKVFSENAYLLEEPSPVGTLLYATDPIVEDRYHTVSCGLENDYDNQGKEVSDLGNLYSAQSIRTAGVGFGNNFEDFANTAEIVLFLSVAYTE